MLLVTHAFSRRNAGDGLLVDLTLDRLERAGVARQTCRVVALDAGSFADLAERGVAVEAVAGEPWQRLSGALPGALWQAGAGLVAAGTRGDRGAGRLAALARAADGFVAVGGGYLRAGGLVASGGVVVNHLAQLAHAAGSRAPAVYLPQSVGPLRGPVGAAVRRLLARVDRVHVRDGRSFHELRGVPGLARTPDLAVLEVARTLPAAPAADSGGGVVIAARDLADEGADALLLDLAGRLGEVRWAVQADGIGPKSDRVHLRRLGLTADGTLRELLPGASAVVSTRLHGALQAWLAGVPALHLGYERKSWGAYADLGLPHLVVDARRFDPSAVAAVVRGLAADPARAWGVLERRRPELLAADAALVDDLRRRLLG